MKSMIKSLTLVAGVALALMGCGGGGKSGITGPTVSVRAVNLAQSAGKIDLRTGRDQRANGMDYLQRTNFVVGAGSVQFIAYAAGTLTLVGNQLVNLPEANKAATVVILPKSGGGVEFRGFAETARQPSAGSATIRFAHVGSSVGTVDMSVVTGPTPHVATGLTFGNASAYVTVAAGSYPIRITKGGTSQTTTGSVNFASGTITTVYVGNPPSSTAFANFMPVVEAP
ncbi:MAG: DUF4397 domain-containing protein [Chthonomonas sp.]|nr:DUF4397 domain-containing protein [Chthonomonas sp.]